MSLWEEPHRPSRRVPKRPARCDRCGENEPVAYVVVPKTEAEGWTCENCIAEYGAHGHDAIEVTS